MRDRREQSSTQFICTLQYLDSQALTSQARTLNHSGRLVYKRPEKGHAWIWEAETGTAPFLIKTGIPVHLLQRHKKKYATGDMDYNSFYFRGPEGKLNLKAYNLIIFTQIAQGVEEETWLFHLKRKDYSNWIRYSIHD